MSALHAPELAVQGVAADALSPRRFGIIAVGRRDGLIDRITLDRLQLHRGATVAPRRGHSTGHLRTLDVSAAAEAGAEMIDAPALDRLAGNDPQIQRPIRRAKRMMNKSEHILLRGEKSCTTAAAEELGLRRATIYRHMRRFCIVQPNQQ